MEDLTKAIELAKKFEGCSLHAYWDKWGHCWTIGWGHTKGVYQGKTCTQDEADLWLQKEMEGVCSAVMHLVKVPINNNQICALTDFAYNCGVGSLQNSTLLRLLNEGAPLTEIADQFLRWDRAGGIILQGLERRRIDEKALFLA